VELRLHREGRWRSWLGARFGGDAALGDRIWRRCLHLAGAIVLIVYVLPRMFFVIAPVDVVLWIALGLVLLLEVLRHTAGLQLPTIRDYEARRVASFAVFATALVVAVEVFPRFIAIPVVLGTVAIDPLLGELRERRWTLRKAQATGGVVYAAFAIPLMVYFGGWPIGAEVAAGGGAAVLGVLSEGHRGSVWADDDLLMTMVPGIPLTMAAWIVAGSISLPAF